MYYIHNYVYFLAMFRGRDVSDMESPDVILMGDVVYYEEV